MYDPVLILQPIVFPLKPPSYGPGFPGKSLVLSAVPLSSSLVPSSRS